MRVYAIGDIHGQLDLLLAAHARIEADRAQCGDSTAPVVHVGDLVDRGPDSRGVIAHLLGGQASGAPWVVLKGNHDRMFACYLTGPDGRDPGRPDLFYLNPSVGGAQPLPSYGVRAAADRPLVPVLAEAQAAVPAEHRAFLENLPLMHRIGPYCFVHAGIRPGIGFDAQCEDDLVWIREPFLSDRRDHGALVVHGHTSIAQATNYGNRINLDSGAAWGGPISAVVLEPGEAWLLTETGREPLQTQTGPAPRLWHQLRRRLKVV